MHQWESLMDSSIILRCSPSPVCKAELHGPSFSGPLLMPSMRQLSLSLQHSKTSFHDTFMFRATIHAWSFILDPRFSWHFHVSDHYSCMQLHFGSNIFIGLSCFGPLCMPGASNWIQVFHGTFTFRTTIHAWNLFLEHYSSLTTCTCYFSNFNIWALSANSW